jgi:hypothetical protein
VLRIFTALALLGLVCLPARASVPTEERQALLKQLHQEREEIRSNAHSTADQAARPDLTPLVGLGRDHLASSLGAPDYCDPPNEKACKLSSHWAYFFYACEPSARQSASGLTEVRVPLGGWAVEVNFSENGVVSNAAWVKQQ